MWTHTQKKWEPARRVRGAQGGRERLSMWGGPNVSRFVFPLPPPVSLFFSSLWESSRGIVAAGARTRMTPANPTGPSNLIIWACLGSFCASPGAGPAEGAVHRRRGCWRWLVVVGLKAPICTRRLAEGYPNGLTRSSKKTLFFFALHTSLCNAWQANACFPFGGVQRMLRTPQLHGTVKHIGSVM